jgi:hypothetical protein
MVWGCAGNLPEAKRTDILDSHQGQSLKSAMNEQVLNPEAGKEPTPVVGLDGKAAAANMEKYRKALKQEEKIEKTVGVGFELRPLRR